MNYLRLKILLFFAVMGILPAGQAYAQSDQFEYSRPSLNPLFVYGDGSAGYIDGALEEARFNRPMGAFYYDESLLLVADTHNRRVRLVQTDKRRVETVVCPPGADASCRDEFVFPVDVSCGSGNTCWVLDAGDGSITRISLNETFEIAERYLPQTDGRPIFRGALGLTASSNSDLLYIANTYDNRIWTYDPVHDGAEPLAGNGKAGFDEKETSALLAPLNNPTALLGIGTSLMILDSRNAMIREIYEGYQSQWIITIFSGGGLFQYLTRESDLGQVYDFGLPFRMAYTDLNPGLFYITIPARKQVVCLTFERQAYVVAGEGAKISSAAVLETPYALAARGNRVAVFDSGNYLRIYSIKKEDKD